MSTQPLNSKAAAVITSATATSPYAQTGQVQGQHQLTKLRGRHHMIIRMAAEGMTNKQIATQLNITPITVSYTLNSELGKARLEVLMGEADMASIDVINEFRGLAPVAVEVLEEIMMDSSAKAADRLSAADKILNGAGVAKHTSVEHTHHLVSDDEIMAAKIASRKKARLTKEVIVDAKIIDANE